MENFISYRSKKDDETKAFSVSLQMAVEVPTRPAATTAVSYMSFSHVITGLADSNHCSLPHHVTPES